MNDLEEAESRHAREKVLSVRVEGITSESNWKLLSKFSMKLTFYGTVLCLS